MKNFQIGTTDKKIYDKSNYEYCMLMEVKVGFTKSNPSSQDRVSLHVMHDTC